MRTLIIALAFLITLLNVGFGATQISNCSVIDTPGVYHLTQDIVGSGADVCIKISASNVTLDGRGYKINGTGRIAIQIYNGSIRLSNVTIRNVSIEGWGKGIELKNADNCSVYNVGITKISYYAVYLYGSGNVLYGINAVDGGTVYIGSNYDANNIVKNSVFVNTRVLSYSKNTVFSNVTIKNFAGTYYAMEIRGSNTTIKNCSITNNSGSGISLAAENSTIESCNISYNGGDGVKIGDSNKIINSTISYNKGYGIILSGSKNTLKGNRIFKNKYNFYAACYYYGGFSDPIIKCRNDVDTSNSVDGKPIYYLIGVENYSVPRDAGVVYCISCNNVTIKDVYLRNNYYGLVLINTTNSIINNVTAAENAYGLFVDYSFNNTIKNSNFSFNDENGILFGGERKYTGNFFDYASRGNVIDSVVVEGNGKNGIRFTFQGDNIIRNAAVLWNSRKGVYSGIDIEGSENVTVEDSYICGNPYGIWIGRHHRFYFIESFNITIRHSRICNSSYYGIYFDHSYNNSVYGNEIIYNKRGVYTQSENKIYNNTINFSNVHGIEISGSMNNVSYNKLYGNGLGFYFYNLPMNPKSLYNIMQNNVVDGDIYYHLFNEKGIVLRNIVLESADRVSNAGKITIVNSTNVVLEDITVANTTEQYSDSYDEAGIYLYETNASKIINVTLFSNDIGIYLYRSYNNIVSNSHIYSNKKFGIYAEKSKNISIIYSNISSSGSGIWFKYSDNNTVAENSMSNNRACISLYYSNKNRISNNFMESSDYGAYLTYSNNNTLINNRINSSKSGIYIVSSNYNTLIGNVLAFNTYGIYLSNSKENVIANSTLEFNSYGIYIHSSNDNRLVNNSLTKNNYGIYIYRSSNNVLRSNLMADNYSFYVEGGEKVSNYINDVDESNKIYGNPIYYLINRSNVEVPKDAGCIILVNSKNITVRDVKISNSGIGILLVSTNETEISNVTLINNDIGLKTVTSSNNKILNNYIAENSRYGIYIRYSDYNEVENNTIFKNNLMCAICGGFVITGSNYNTITKNTIAESGCTGLDIGSSNANFIYLNNIFNTTCYSFCGAYCRGNGYSVGSVNTWRSPTILKYVYNGSEFLGYLGNYWGDYRGVDSDGNGVGDTPYVIRTLPMQDYSEEDYYPLMMPFESYLEIPISTTSKAEEVVSNKTEMLENITVYTANIETKLSGNYSGEMNFTQIRMIYIASGEFKGRGFLIGNWSSVLDGREYTGTLHGILVEKFEEGRIYIKGVLNGEAEGVINGYVIKNSSKFYAEAILSNVGNNTVYASVYLNGSVEQISEENFTSKLYTLQVLLKGSLSGQYNGSINVFITHVRIDNSTSQYHGRGMAIISYSSAYGTGSGWAYCEMSNNITNLIGFFKKPLEGIISGTLDETGVKKKISIFLKRIDLGRPPIAEINLILWGPVRVSPGETVDYNIEYRNDGLKDAENVVIAAQLPYPVEYVSSTNDGVYHARLHQVFWKLGTIKSGERGILSFKVRYHWGLRAGEVYEIYPLFGTTSPASYTTICNIDKYLKYKPTKVIYAEVVPTENLSDELRIELSNKQVYELYNYSKELGYNYTKTIIRMRFSNNVTIVRILMLNESNYPLLITNYNNSAYFIEQYLNDSIRIFNRSGGMVYYFLNNSYSGWGTWNITRSPSVWQCIVNGIIQSVPSWALSRLADLLTGGAKIAVKVALALPDCGGCISTIFDKKLPIDTSCANCLSNGVESIPFIGEAVGAAGIVADCIGDPEKYACTPGSTKTACAKDLGLFYRLFDFPNKLVIFKCSSYGFWEKSDYIICDAPPEFGGYGSGTKCSDGRCVTKDKIRGAHVSRIAVAHDPNIKYGPEGFVKPGQLLNYTVEFENEGNGSAFGVYFVDFLDEDLNESTLEISPVYDKNGSIIAPKGIYDKNTRTITWFVGKVGPKEGGYANISVRVREDAEEGTEIINYAIVYFPSVPEETRTNSIVSVVDINAPRYYNVSQSKDRVNVGDFITLKAYWKDGTQLNWAWLEINESGKWENISYAKLLSSEEWSIFEIKVNKEGDICWRIYVNDTAGNVNSTEIRCFTAEKMGAPAIKIIVPANNSYMEFLQLYVVSDKPLREAVAEVWGHGTKNITLNGSGTKWYGNLSLSEGEYFVRVWGTDYENNTGISDVYKFTIVSMYRNISTTITANESKVILNTSHVTIEATATTNTTLNISVVLSYRPLTKELNRTTSYGKAENAVKYVKIDSFTPQQNIGRINITLYFVRNEVTSFDTDTLALFYWNNTAWISTIDSINKTIPDTSGGLYVYHAGKHYDQTTGRGYVYAVVNHTSVFAIGGEVKQVAVVPTPSAGGEYSPEVVILANSIDLSLAKELVEKLKKNRIKVYIANASNFSEYKTKLYIIVLGGHEAYEGIGDIVAEITTSEERANISKGKVFIKKKSVFRSGQTVYIFAGANRFLTAEAWKNNINNVIKEIKYNMN